MSGTFPMTDFDGRGIEFQQLFLDAAMCMVAVRALASFSYFRRSFFGSDGTNFGYKNEAVL